ncbi:NlpC/P60 family protein [Escherichia coli]
MVSMPTTRSLRRSSHARPTRCITTIGQRLWRITTCGRGDLLFFHIHSREIADHMGVYLGDGQFYPVAAHRGNHSGKPVSRTFLAGPFFGRAQDFDGKRRFCKWY